MFDTNYNTSTMSEVSIGAEIAEISGETQEILSFCRRSGWHTSILGAGPLPESAVRLGDWVVVPVHLDSTDIPSRAQLRIQALYAAGFRPQGFVLVHEAPDKVLPKPAYDEPSVHQAESTRPRRPRDRVSAWIERLGITTNSTGMIVGVVIAALAILTLGAALIFPLALILGLAAGLDPILVAVMEDGNWIEIDRWETS